MRIVAATDKVRQEYETTAILGCRAVREFLNARGTNRGRLDRARAGAIAMASYARLRGTMANEEALRMAADRSGLAPKQLNGKRLRRAS